MTFKGRIIFSFGIFILLVAGLGGWLFVNGLRESNAFLTSRNALRVQYMVQDMDYFLNRKFRAIQTYVMLDDEAEKLQIFQAQSAIKKKFSIWEKWVIAGESNADDISIVKKIDEDVSRIGNKILKLVDKKQKMDAIRLVERAFLPIAGKARTQLKTIKEKTIQDTIDSENIMARVVRESHIASLVGILLACILGVLLSVYLYNSLMKPMRILKIWAEQIGHGNMHVSLDLPGNNEMAQLASNFNSMIHNLSRQQTHKEKVKEEKISTLEDAIDGFRDVLDIMGSSPVPKAERKSHKV